VLLEKVFTMFFFEGGVKIFLRITIGRKNRGGKEGKKV
jgi:hypothetical protein